MQIRRWMLMVTLVGSLTGCYRQSQWQAAPALLYNDHKDELRRTFESGIEAGGGGGGSNLGEPSGWTTLVGRFTLNGAAPPRSPLNIDKDQSVCAPGGRQVLREDLVVSADGGIRDVLIYVSSKLPQDDPKWAEHEHYAENKFGEVLFDQEACVFLTHVATMRATQTLLVKNSDPVGHNTNLDSKRGARSANFNVPAGQSLPYEPGSASKSGPFSVTCSIHPWMKANMMVFDHPYSAVTAEDGTFEIPYIPGGVELEFRVWQEKSGFLQNVTVNGETKQWSKGRFKLPLPSEQQVELNVVVDAAEFQ